MSLPRPVQQLAGVLAGRVRFEDLSAADRAGVASAGQTHGVGALLEPLHPELAGIGLPARYEAIRLGAFTWRVHRALAAAGIEHVVLKGVTVAAYWSQPAARPQTDVDVLIRKADLAGAVEALEQAELVRVVDPKGLHFFHLALPPRDRSGSAVELHWELRSDPPIDVSVEELFSRKTQVATPEGGIPALEVNDAAVYVAVHAAFHGLERLAWLVDIAALATRMDAGTAAARAREWRVSVPVELAWSQAARLMDAPIDRVTLDALRVTPTRRALARGSLSAVSWSRPPLTKWCRHLYVLALMDSMADAAGSLRRSWATRRANPRRQRQPVPG